MPADPPPSPVDAADGADAVDAVRDSAADVLVGGTPSLFTLARSGPWRVSPPGGEALYRRIARALELDEGHEFVVVPCGAGLTVRLLSELTGAVGSGADPDPEMIQAARAEAREAGLMRRLQYEVSLPEDLPYQDVVFDAALGEIGLVASADSMAAVRELVRVTKPRGRVVLAQLSWAGAGSPAGYQALVDYLGVRPLLLVEWKRFLRDSGVVDITVEDWTDAGADLRWPFGMFHQGGSLPWRERFDVLHRGWRRWGWRGVRRLLAKEQEFRRSEHRERLFSLSLISGVKSGSHVASQV